MVANWQERTDAEDDAGGDPGFGQGGAPGSKAESCRHSEPLAARVQGPIKGLEAFGFLMLKYAFSYMLEPLFLSF